MTKDDSLKTFTQAISTICALEDRIIDTHKERIEYMKQFHAAVSCGKTVEASKYIEPWAKLWLNILELHKMLEQAALVGTKGDDHEATDPRSGCELGAGNALSGGSPEPKQGAEKSN